MDPGALTIGVVAGAEERGVVREFFELFKTPWEFCRENQRYRVVLHADRAASCSPADLVILYGSEPNAFDQARKRLPGTSRSNAVLCGNGERIPLYGRCAPFPSDGSAPELVLEDTGEPVAGVIRCESGTVVRVGYDLFEEIRFLLTRGQPAAHAGIPTLERHIGLLRKWILGSGIPLVEIPPVPEGRRFIVCLTHDLDHPSIRLHKLDHTTLGFLKRALVGSLVKVCRGQAPLGTLWRNVGAVLRLPFVHLGWAEDFWATSGRYLKIERGLGSTFFAIPVKGNPGRTLDGPAPRLRASAYGVADIADQVRTIVAAGSEVGVHGIDAWLDSRRACEEREAVSRVAGTPAAGTRMHWLFFDERAPERLDEAGFGYDSTFGYNETVGFRAGTLQVFKPITARRLLEVPLTIMDTALFYPSYLNLTQEAAQQVVRSLADDAERHGGALTINWHDRSLAPERLWGRFYTQFVDELKGRTAWFPTVGQAVAWFRQRRSTTFDSVRWDGDSVRVTASADCHDDLPALRVRVHIPCSQNGEGALKSHRQTRFIDVTFRTSVDAHVRFDVFNNPLGYQSGIRGTQESETR